MRKPFDGVIASGERTGGDRLLQCRDDSCEMNQFFLAQL